METSFLGFNPVGIVQSGDSPRMSLLLHITGILGLRAVTELFTTATWHLLFDGHLTKVWVWIGFKEPPLSPIIINCYFFDNSLDFMNNLNIPFGNNEPEPRGGNQWNYALLVPMLGLAAFRKLLNHNTWLQLRCQILKIKISTQK